MSIHIRNEVQAREFQKKVDKYGLVMLNLPPIAWIFMMKRLTASVVHD
jgi:hypothetical protein